MDLFFETAPVERRRRVHFHAFMLEVHARLHRWRETARSGGAGLDQALPELAKAIADEAWLLCFDEFHVVDIADAMILGRLFTALFDLGVVVVATSNWAPDDLYKDGLQRDRFLAFIALLKTRLDVLELSGTTDYRLNRIKGIATYYQPLGPGSAGAMRAAWDRLTGGVAGAPYTLTVQGRAVTVPRAAGDVAWCDFDGLCAKPLGAADYLAIATHFPVVLIDRVPRLGEAQRNEAKRFILLIDSLYEHKVHTVIAADAPPDRLYLEGRHAFEFHRTISRMMEMQSEEYLKAPHLP
jgi:cell division protein ZapE